MVNVIMRYTNCGIYDPEGAARLLESELAKRWTVGIRKTPITSSATTDLGGKLLLGRGFPILLEHEPLLLLTGLSFVSCLPL